MKSYYTGFFRKSEEFQICIAAAASIALLQATVLFSIHYEPSHIHHTLNIVSKIF